MMFFKFDDGCLVQGIDLAQVREVGRIWERQHEAKKRRHLEKHFRWGGLHNQKGYRRYGDARIAKWKKTNFNRG